MHLIRSPRQAAVPGHRMADSARWPAVAFAATLALTLTGCASFLATRSNALPADVCMSSDGALPQAPAAGFTSPVRSTPVLCACVDDFLEA